MGEFGVKSKKSQFSDYILNIFFEIFGRKLSKLEEETIQKLTKYIEMGKNKYSKTKTILYKDKPVPLQDFYVDITLKCGDLFIDSSNLNKILEINNCLVISATAGSGKSTLFKRLFTRILEDGNYIPLFVELRNLNDLKIGVFQYISQTLLGMNTNGTNDIVSKLLDEGKVILLLDGYDEIDRDLRGAITKEIINISETFGNSYFLVSSRPDEEEFLSWNNFSVIDVLPMSKEQAMLLISKIKYEEIVKIKFLEEVDKILYHEHQEFVSNPLLLTIMLMTFSQYAEVPNKIHIFYEQAFETLFNKHDATKAVYTRDRFTNLPIDDFKKVLSAFSALSYLKGNSSFDYKKTIEFLKSAREVTRIEFNEDALLKDLLKSVCILAKDGLFYTFSHRTFQEYFTALFIIDSKQKIQKSMLKEIHFRVRKDKVFDFLFAMDKTTLEESFIIPVLDDIREEIGYNSLPVHEYLIRFLSVSFDKISFSKEGNLRYFLKDKFAYSITDIINIVGMYADIEKSRRDKESKEFISQLYISLHDKVDITYEMKDDGTNESVEFLEISITNPLITEALPILAKKFLNGLESSMKLLEKIKAEQKQQDEALKEIIESGSGIFF